MLDALPEHLASRHVAPHLSDEDVANCSAAFKRGNPLLGERDARRRRFLEARDDLRLLAERLAEVLRHTPPQQIEERLFALGREHGYSVARVPRPYTLFALYTVHTPHFRADVCAFARHADGHVAITHADSGRRGYMQWRRKYVCVTSGGDDALQPTLQQAVELGVGLRRSKRLVIVPDVTS